MQARLITLVYKRLDDWLIIKKALGSSELSAFLFSTSSLVYRIFGLQNRLGIFYNFIE